MYEAGARDLANSSGSSSSSSSSSNLRSAVTAFTALVTLPLTYGSAAVWHFPLSTNLSAKGKVLCYLDSVNGFLRHYTGSSPATSFQVLASIRRLSPAQYHMMRICRCGNRRYGHQLPSPRLLRIYPLVRHSGMKSEVAFPRTYVTKTSRTAWSSFSNSPRRMFFVRCTHSKVMHYFHCSVERLAYRFRNQPRRS